MCLLLPVIPVFVLLVHSHHLWPSLCCFLFSPLQKKRKVLIAFFALVCLAQYKEYHQISWWLEVMFRSHVATSSKQIRRKFQWGSQRCILKVILHNDMWLLKKQKKHLHVSTRWRDVWTVWLRIPPPACSEFAAPPNHRHYSCLKNCFQTGNQSLSR